MKVCRGIIWLQGCDETKTLSRIKFIWWIKHVCKNVSGYHRFLEWQFAVLALLINIFVSYWSYKIWNDVFQFSVKNGEIPDWSEKDVINTRFKADILPVAAKLKELAHCLPEVCACTHLCGEGVNNIFSNQFVMFGLQQDRIMDL